ncbi:MAG TPA: DUF4129 domain-containing protein [Mycobacteriales bacterium]|nr:DUF4129 domain-containing protein [Mycobacteriales bacterium]
MTPFLPLPWQDPGGITRGGARDEARRELRKAIYHVGDEGPVQRVIRWLFRWVSSTFDKLSRVAPGGVPSLLIIVVLIVLLVVAIRIGLGPARLRNALTDRRRDARSRSAQDYRDEAEALAARGEHKEAVRARFRAIIRELEERAVLDPRAGRTAGEIAREGSAAVPAVAGDLRAAAGTFDRVWYGRHRADRADYDAVAAADDAIRTARLVTVPEAVG